MGGVRTGPDGLPLAVCTVHLLPARSVSLGFPPICLPVTCFGMLPSLSQSPRFLQIPPRSPSPAMMTTGILAVVRPL